MTKRTVIGVFLLVLIAALRAQAQKPVTAILLTPLPKSAFCAARTDYVAAACFRLTEDVNALYKARDSVWVYITCPENFSPGFWRANTLYEVHLSGDTSSLKNMPRLSLPKKNPVGMVRSARRIAGK